MGDLLEKVKTFRWWAILKALPFEGGPSSTKWVYLAQSASMAVIALSLAAAIEYRFVRHGHVDTTLVAALVTIVGILSTSATVALNHRRSKNAEMTMAKQEGEANG